MWELDAKVIFNFQGTLQDVLFFLFFCQLSCSQENKGLHLKEKAKTFYRALSINIHMLIIIKQRS